MFKTTEQLLAELRQLAPEGYYFGFHIRYTRPTRVELTYRPDWAAHYAERNFVVQDPTVAWPMMNLGVIRWSENPLPDPGGVFEAAARFGYRFGATVGYGPAESRTLGSAGRGDREFTSDEMARLHELVGAIHDALAEGPALKPHQRAALKLIASGRTYDQCCHDLGISPTALKNRLRGARQVLGVDSNGAAIRLAIQRGLVDPGPAGAVASGLPGRAYENA